MHDWDCKDEEGNNDGRRRNGAKKILPLLALTAKSVGLLLTTGAPAPDRRGEEGYVVVPYDTNLFSHFLRWLFSLAVSVGKRAGRVVYQSAPRRFFPLSASPSLLSSSSQ